MYLDALKVISYQSDLNEKIRLECFYYDISPTPILS